MNSRHINEKGFSLIEAIIAAVILTSTVFLFTYFSSQSQRKVNSSLNTICQNIADTSLNKILALGYGSELAGISFQNNQVNTSTLINNYLIPADRITTPTQAISGSAGNHTVNSYRSIIGSMYLLDRLYNKGTSVCNSNLGIEYPTLLENTDPSERLQNIVTRIKIQPQNLITNVRNCEGTPFFTRPAGVDEGSLLGVSSPLNVRSDFGYHVLVTTQYTDPKDASNTQYSCASAALFAYPKQRLVSEATTTLGVTITPGTVPRCANTGPQTQLRISPPPGFDSRLGLLPFCRDRSTPSNPPPACPTGRTGQPFTTTQNYVPCNQVTLCGQPRTSSTTDPATGVITNIYATTPIGCNFAIDAQLVDEAMNVRQNPAPGSRNPAPTPGCEPCQAPRPLGPGYCPPSGTLMNQCNPLPPPPPPSGGGGGGGDGTDGGNDGRGGDGSNG